MNKQKKNIFFDFLSAGFEGGYETEAVRKSILINFFAVVGILSLLIFGIKGILSERIAYSLTLFSFLAGVVILIFFLRNFKKVLVSGHIIVTLMYLLCVFLLFNGGEEMTGMLWFYCFPVVALFILGRIVGSIYLVTIFALVLFVFITNPDFAPDYSVVFKQRFAATFIVSNFLTYIFETVREKTYKSFLVADEKKTFYINQVLQQKEEIIAQSEKLEEINRELEKLSIVASETNNSVAIFDAKGKPEWVNDGFTRMYGYTLDEFIMHKGNSLLDMALEGPVKETVQRCFTQRKPVHYSTFLSTKFGTNIWIQTTLTPILGINGEIVKVVAIDADISKLKEAEEAIQQQKEELQAQSELLRSVNIELEKSNNLLTDSIYYAKKIQEAILPSETLIRSYFTDSFVLYKPKNIVSGDFFWLTKHEEKVFVSVADCTGHGVSGAFMSMMGNALLNEIVNEKKILNPDEILTQLNRGVNYALSQGGSDVIQNDGMDIALCCIDLKQRKLNIASANQYVIIIEDGKMQEIEGSIFSIGGEFENRKLKKTYQSQEFDITENTQIYMFTDGYQDQFGGENDKKFSITKLESLIADINLKKLDEQKNILETEFEAWKGNHKQTDDVLVLGFKI